MDLNAYANPQKEQILAMLGLKEVDIERYRGCELGKDHIRIHCRTGGGNREGYPNEILTKHPLYIQDEDDDFDCTYADYYFKLPEKK